MIEDLVRLIKFGVITIESIVDESVRSRVENELSKDE